MVRLGWYAGVVLVGLGAPLQALAQNLDQVGLARQGDHVIVTLSLSAPAPVHVTLNGEGTLVTIDLDRVTIRPGLPPLDAAGAGLNLALVTPSAGGTRLTLVARQALRLADPPADSTPQRPSLRFDALAPVRAATPAQAPKVQARLTPGPIPALALAPKGRDMPALPPPPTLLSRLPVAALPQSPPPAVKAPPADVAVALLKMCPGSSALDEEAARDGKAEAAAILGNACLKSSTPDPAMARRWFEKAANLGDASSAYNLGQLHRLGLGGTRDEQAAVRWYEQAARAEFPAAEYNLALLLIEGRGTSPDEKRAIALLERAEAQGFARAGEVLRALKAAITKTP